MENFFKLPLGLGLNITAQPISTGKSRLFPLQLNAVEQQSILSSLPTESEDKYLRGRVYLGDTRSRVSFFDVKNGVAHIEVQGEIKPVSIEDVTLFPQTEDFVDFVKNAKLCQYSGDGNWSNEAAKDHMETYIVTDEEEIGNVWLLPPCLSCHPVGVDKDDTLLVTNLNDSFQTKSMAYSLLGAYAWHKDQV